MNPDVELHSMYRSFTESTKYHSLSRATLPSDYLGYVRYDSKFGVCVNVKRMIHDIHSSIEHKINMTRVFYLQLCSTLLTFEF